DPATELGQLPHPAHPGNARHRSGHPSLLCGTYRGGRSGDATDRPCNREWMASDDRHRAAPSANHPRCMRKEISMIRFGLSVAMTIAFAAPLAAQDLRAPSDFKDIGN